MDKNTTLSSYMRYRKQEQKILERRQRLKWKVLSAMEQHGFMTADAILRKYHEAKDEKCDPREAANATWLRLRKKGYIQRKKDGLMHITEKGQQYLEGIEK